jgi:hypothetical protein
VSRDRRGDSSSVALLCMADLQSRNSLASE